MKRFFKMLMIATVLVVALAVSAAAVSLTYSLEPYDADAGEYDLVVNIAMGNETEKANTFATTLEFNNEVVGPLSTDSGYITAASVTLTEGRNENTYKFNITDEAWTTDGTTTSLLASCYTTDFDKFNCTNLNILTIPLKLADGVSVEDIKQGDIVVAKAYLATNYGTGRPYGFNEPNCDDSFEAIVNNAVSAAPAAPITVPVTAGDVIYLPDGTKVVAEETGNYTVEATSGYVVVNTGAFPHAQTAQKVYEIANGAATEATEYANGTLNLASASVKAETESTGIRYKTTFASGLKASIKESGFLVTVESAYLIKAGLDVDNYELNMELLEKGWANKGVAYNGTTDKYDVDDGENKTVYAVVNGIPLNADSVLTYVAIRPYYILEDDTVIYGEVAKNTIYDVAKSVKTNDAETYAKYKDYVDAILSLVDGEITIPGEDVFAIG